MKTLNNQTELQTAIIEKHGVFFAFGKSQLEEQIKPDTKYFSIGGGCHCPQDNYDAYNKEMTELMEAGVKFIIDNNSKKDIIWDSLANYETQITGDISDAVEALKEYGYTREEIQKEYGNGYFQHCIDNDYF